MNIPKFRAWDKEHIKKTFIKWVENHPDCWHDDHMWYLQNLVGDLIEWEEQPEDWIKHLIPS